MSVAVQTPEQLAVSARILLEREDLTETGLWPRAGAVLARQSLEEALRLLWARVAPELADLSMRAQMLCAADYLGPTLAGQASYTWAALSRACHHHAYELAPTLDELNGWIDEVDALIAAIRDQTTAHTGAA